MSKNSRRRRERRDGQPTDRAWADYTDAFRRNVFPNLVTSAYMITVAERVTPDDVDLRAATELGLMLLLDKPLVIVVPVGTTISAAMRRAAAVVIEDWDPEDPASQERMAAAFRDLAEEAGT